MGLSIISNWCRIYSAHKCPQYHLIHLVRARSKADDMCQWSMPLPHCYTGSCKKKNRLHKLQAHTPWKLETTLLLLVVLWLIASSYLGFNHDSPASWICLDFLTDFLSHTKHHPAGLKHSSSDLPKPADTWAQRSTAPAGPSGLARCGCGWWPPSTWKRSKWTSGCCRWKLGLSSIDAKNLSGSKAKGL